jgi:2-dehydropantoate 2-reductase
MKTLFVGAGAIGSLLAGYAAKGGTDVTLLDIADHIHTIGRDGLNIRTVGGETFNVKMKATADARAIKDIDLLILTVKTFHTEPALASVAHLKDRVRCVLSVQNGVEKEEHLARFFGKEKVLGAICLEGATRLGPNEIQHTMSNITYVGELDGKTSERASSVAALLASGGIKVEASTEILPASWAKWINFAASALLCSLTRLEYYKVLKYPELAALFAEVYRELAGLAKAKGVEVRDYPGFEVKSISEGPPDKAVAMVKARGEMLEARGMTKVKPSLCQDVEAGRRTEYEAIFGYAVWEAAKLGVNLPLTAYAYRFLKGIDQALG